MGSETGNSVRSNSGALKGAILGGLAILAVAAPTVGEFVSAFARDVGNNCSLPCLSGALGAAFAFGASLGDDLREWARRINREAHNRGGFPGNDVSAIQ